MATKYEYRTYVIELATEPGAVYVGQTAKAPQDRLAQHHAGIKAARVFKKGAHGRLRLDLCGTPSAFATRYEAVRAEQRLAKRLRRRGMKVYVG